MPGIGDLQQLDRRATSGPWFVLTDSQLPVNAQGDVDWPQHLVGKLLPHWDYYLKDEDAQLIVTMRNSLHLWFAVIEAARGLANAWGTDGVQRARIELNSALQRLEDV